MHKITEVTPGEGLTLHLTYQDGATVHADLSGLLTGAPGVFALLANRAFFERVFVMPRGRGISWPGELDLDADTLRMPNSDPNKPEALRLLESTPGTPPDPVSLMLREAVSASGLTQAEVAQRAGMLQPALARLLDLNYHSHSLTAVRQVAAALGRRLDLNLVEVPDAQ